MIDQFYLERFPALSLPGWEETGAKRFGLVRFQRAVETNSPQLTARHGFILREWNSTVFLEVRHSASTSSSLYYFAGEISADELIKKTEKLLPKAEADVLAKHYVWAAEIIQEVFDVDKRKD